MGDVVDAPSLLEKRAKNKQKGKKRSGEREREANAMAMARFSVLSEFVRFIKKMVCFFFFLHKKRKMKIGIR